jgi:phosphoglycolate phosphatase-like HAD superfamily hydrolase
MTGARAEATPSPDRRLAVVDIDGVVADVRHRLHLVEQRPKQWEEFFALAAQDPPLAEGVALVRELAAEHDVVWLTGRPARTRRLTERWLAEQGLPAGVLVMRPDRDYRPARFTKREELRRLRRRRQIAVVVDDDPEVTATLAEDGFPVRLADWLPHSSTLRAAQEREGRT